MTLNWHSYVIYWTIIYSALYIGLLYILHYILTLLYTLHYILCIIYSSLYTLHYILTLLYTLHYRFAVGLLKNRFAVSQKRKEFFIKICFLAFLWAILKEHEKKWEKYLMGKQEPNWKLYFLIYFFLWCWTWKYQTLTFFRSLLDA